jgi:hypothetical protein
MSLGLLGLMSAMYWRPPTVVDDHSRVPKSAIERLCGDHDGTVATGVVEVIGIDAESLSQNQLVPLVYARTIVVLDGELDDFLTLLVRPGVLYREPPPAIPERVIGRYVHPADLSRFGRSQSVGKPKSREAAIGTTWVVRVAEEPTEVEGAPVESLRLFLAYSIPEDEIPIWSRRVRRRCKLE